MPFLFLLFVLVPIVEIALFVKVGGAIGLLPTLAIVVATAALGTLMLRRQGLATFARAQERLRAGRLPAGELVEGALLLVGGVLLLTPGFLTDAMGFFCLVPPTRRWLAARIAAGALGRVGVVAGRRVGTGADAGPRPRFGGGVVGAPDAAPGDGRGPSHGRPGDVIDGDYERLD